MASNLECENVEIYPGNSRGLISLIIEGLVVDSELIEQIGLAELLDVIGEDACVSHFNLELKDGEE